MRIVRATEAIDMSKKRKEQNGKFGFVAGTSSDRYVQCCFTRLHEGWNAKTLRRAQMSQKILVVTVLSVMLASACASTRSTVDRKPKTRAELIAILQPGKKVRVFTPDTRLLEGKVVRVTKDSLALSQDRFEKNLPVDDITDVWTRPSRVATESILGALGGGIFGVLVGGMLDIKCVLAEGNSNGDVDCSDRPNYFEYGVAIGVISGAVVGGLDGAVRSDWQQVYP